MKNSLPFEIESLCFQELDGKKIPVWPYVAAVTGHHTFAKPGEVEGLPGYDRETIKKAFQRELEQMARRWKESCNKKFTLFKHKEVNAPFILLTSLVEGADQLAAEAAVELPEDLNVKVVIILPMEKELFKLTLSEEAKTLFDKLYDSAFLTYSLPLPEKWNNDEYRAKLTDVNNPETKDLYKEQHDRVSKFLALHSHVLFALWDGIDMSAMPNGGTSNTLHYKLEGNIENQTQSDILTYTSVGPVVQFLLPRNNEENLKEPIAKFENPEEIAVFYWSKHDLWDEKTMSYFFPDRSLMTEKNRCKTSVSSIPDIVDVFDRIGNLNWYSVKYSHKLQKEFDESRFHLFGKRRDVQDYYDAETEALVQHFTYIDKLAEQFKSRMKKIVDIYFIGIILFFVSSAVLSSFWEIHLNKWGNGPVSKYFNNEAHTCNNEVLTNNNETHTLNNESHSWCDMYNLSPFWTITYWSSIVLFFSVYCLTKWLWKNRVRFYRFRTVAGALKVQIFWRIAEMSDCVSGHYRTHQLPDTEWLRAAINGLDVLFSSPEAKNIERTLADRLIFVRDIWIQGQLMYYQGKLKNDKEERSNLILELTMLTFWLFIFFSFPLIPTWLDFLHENHPVLAECCQVVYDLVLVLFPIYGFYLFWTKVYQPQSELNRFKQMLFPFDRAFLLVNTELKKMDPLDFEKAQKADDSIEKIITILRQLGTESVSENASWYLSLGERKLILPH